MEHLELDKNKLPSKAREFNLMLRFLGFNLKYAHSEAIRLAVDRFYKVEGMMGMKDIVEIENQIQELLVKHNYPEKKIVIKEENNEEE